MNKHLRLWLICGGATAAAPVAAAVCAVFGVFGADGLLFNGVLFYLLLLPPAAIVCGAVMGYRRPAWWFVYPLFVIAVAALFASPAKVGFAPALLLFTALPAAVGLGAGVVIRLVRQRVLRKRGEGTL